MENSNVKYVIIPARIEHEGFYWRGVYLNWVCPACGAPRGEPHKVLSYDGSRRMSVDGWENSCGHVDKYSSVRREADSNGLNL